MKRDKAHDVMLCEANGQLLLLISDLVITFFILALSKITLCCAIAIFHVQFNITGLFTLYMLGIYSHTHSVII